MSRSDRNGRGSGRGPIVQGGGHMRPGAFPGQIGGGRFPPAEGCQPPIPHRYDKVPEEYRRHVLDAQDAQLGQSLVLELGQRQSQQEVLRVSGDSQGAMSLALVLGSLIMNENDEPQNDGHAEVNCRLVFGQGGASIVADVDWRTGTQVRIPGSFLAIQAINEALDNDQISRIQCTAFVTNYTTGAYGPPTRTFDQILSEELEGTSIVVPPFATRLSLFSDAGTYGDLFVEQRGGLRDVSRLIDRRAAAVNYEPQNEGFKISGRTRSIVFRSAAEPGGNITPVFNLDL